MDETVIVSKETKTVKELRDLLRWVGDEMPVRDHIKRCSLQVSLIETDQGKVLEVS